MRNGNFGWQVDSETTYSIVMRIFRLKRTTWSRLWA